MSGVNTILRLVGVVVAIVVVIYSGWIGVTVIEPYNANMPDADDSLNWPDTSETLRFVGLSLMGLVFTLFAWLWLAPVRSDVRQETRPPGGPF